MASLRRTPRDLETSQHISTGIHRQWTYALDAIPEPVFLHDAEYRIVRANSAYTERAGMPLKDLIGRRYFEVFPKSSTQLPTCSRLVHGDADEEAEELALPNGEVLVSRERAVRTPDGRFLCSLHVLADVTEQKRAQDSSRAYERIVSATPDHVSVVNRDYTYRIVNDSYLKAHGKSRDEIVGHTASELLGADSFEGVIKGNLDKALGGEQAQYRAWFNFAAAGRRYMSVTCSPFLERGEITGVLVSARDVTDLMRAELAVRETEAQYASIFENSLNGIALHEIIIDEEGRPVDFVFLNVNDAFERLTGLDADDVIGKRATQVIPGIEYGQFIDLCGKVALEGEPSRFEEFVAPLHKVYEVAAFSPKKGQFTTLFSDITERRQSEEAIKVRSRRLSVINALLQLGLQDISLQSQLERALDEILSIQWLPLEGKGAIFLVDDEDDRSLMLRAARNLSPSLHALCRRVPFGRCLCGRAAVSGRIEHAPSVDESHERRHESMVPHAHYCVPIARGEQMLGVLVLYLPDGHQSSEDEQEFLTAAGTTLAGIIGRKRAEEALQESEERFRSVSSAAYDALIMLDGEGRVSLWNDAAVRMFGYRPEEAVGVDLTELVIPRRFRERHRSAMRRFTQSGRVSLVGKPMELVASRKDGSEFPVEISVSGARRGDVWHAVGIVRDITERKRMEDQAHAHAERLEYALVQTVEAIALTIEKRDPYTAGHQRRVAELAAAIGRAMKLSKEQVDGIYLGGLVHDIGKIFIPAEILNRPGKLTDSEFGIIKSHPEVGYEIIRDVDFSWPIGDIVLQHHERLDGSGYPQGLKDGEIALEAKILAVADVVEAITSHRPYRARLGLEVALEEIVSKRGRFYDAGAVDACIMLLKEKRIVLG